MSFERYKEDIRKLVATGEQLKVVMYSNIYPNDPQIKKLPKEYLSGLPNFIMTYQSWYSEALSVIEQLMPNRVDDFTSYYAPHKTRKMLSYESYTISDYLRGLSRKYPDGSVIVGMDAAVAPLQQQLSIVKSLENRFESSLFDIKTIIQADLFADELEAAAELNKKGFQRGAGAMAGVVLEGHLRMVCGQHKLTTPKGAMLGKLNEILKEGGAVDIPTWRFIQHLTDIRNLCDHKTTSEPTKENVAELIDGVRKITKTVY